MFNFRKVHNASHEMLSFLRTINIHVILSVPIPSSVFGAKISSNIVSTGVLVGKFLLSFNFFYIVVQAYSLSRQSHIPSQAFIINLSDF